MLILKYIACNWQTLPPTHEQLSSLLKVWWYVRLWHVKLSEVHLVACRREKKVAWHLFHFFVYCDIFTHHILQSVLDCRSNMTWLFCWAFLRHAFPYVIVTFLPYNSKWSIPYLLFYCDTSTIILYFRYCARYEEIRIS